MQTNWMRSLFTPHLWESGLVEWLQLVAGGTASYLTLPVIGLYFSLRRMNHLVSWLCACAVGLLVPWLLFQHWHLLLELLTLTGVQLDLPRAAGNSRLLSLIVAFSWQLTAALMASALLRLNLGRRRFLTN
jgi:hypothetical protein